MSDSIRQQTLDRRQAGVLLHVTSLPSPGSCGTLGAQARHFVDFLADCGFGLWQMLPVGPTQADGSPYQSSSSHAGNPELIDLDELCRQGLIDDRALAAYRAGSGSLDRLLTHAHEQGLVNPDLMAEFQAFCSENDYWLDEYALFNALHHEARHCCWWQWPAPLRDRQSRALSEVRQRLAPDIERIRFTQFLFFRQWMALKAYANERGVRLFGDMPIFVAHDSAEVWAARHYFDLTDDGECRVVAGVPPDYFSETGQRWGNPLYRWDRMRQDDFRFWVERLRTQRKLFDLIRIDHFRGFQACWEIPGEQQTAVNGQWREAPGDALFERLHRIYDPLPLVAEDLGIITPEVEALRERFGLPGMKVLLFAFEGGSDNPYLPFRHTENSVVYTGTHDNNTTLGWYRGLSQQQRSRVDEWLGYSRESMPWPLIRMALGSVAKLAVLPMQDLLELDSEHRMNLPGTTEGNWRWRFQWQQVTGDLATRMRHLLQMYGRVD